MRLQNEFRLSIKRRGGRTQKIELIPQYGGKRYLIRVDGKNAEDKTGMTITEFSIHLRKWFVKK